MEEKKMYYDRSRLLEMLVDLREAKDELVNSQQPSHARLIALAITDMESADNWLMRAMDASWQDLSNENPVGDARGEPDRCG